MTIPTYAACLTPAGTGAIATVALIGPEAWSLVEPIFRPRHAKSLDQPFLLGRLGEGVGDEVVVSRYNRDLRQRVEIHCHGGSAVVRWLLDLFRSRGAVELSWEEYLKQTSGTRLQTEAAIALAHARTLRTANILLDQYHGAFERAVRQVIAALEGGRASEATRGLGQLLQWIRLGRHLTRPWRVAVAGAPNVGKSSLVNCILGFQRSITSPVPGTTRDVVTALTALEGWPVELLDTAGARDQATGLEGIGIERAREAWEAADLCLWVVDLTLPPVRHHGPYRDPPLTVLNKVDLAAGWHHAWTGGEALKVSALTGEGIPALLAAIVQRLVPRLPQPGTAMPFTDALCDLLQEAQGSLETGHASQAIDTLRTLVHVERPTTPAFPDALAARWDRA